MSSCYPDYFFGSISPPAPPTLVAQQRFDTNLPCPQITSEFHVYPFLARKFHCLVLQHYILLASFLVRPFIPVPYASFGSRTCTPDLIDKPILGPLFISRFRLFFLLPLASTTQTNKKLWNTFYICAHQNCLFGNAFGTGTFKLISSPLPSLMRYSG